MGDKVNLVLQGRSTSVDKQKATAMMQEFFTENKVSGFNVNHQGKRDESSFVIGTLATTNGNFRVNCFLKKVQNQYLIHQIRIDKINDYIQRTKRSITFDMEVIPELKNTKSLSMEVQKEKEGELILKALQPGDVVVLLDEHGKEMRSLEFAEYMKRKMNTVNKRLVFIIGGPYGFSEKVYQAAHEKISMSKMTFSHQMIRLIFVEQIYRAMTILNGGPYHHE